MMDHDEARKALLELRGQLEARQARISAHAREGVPADSEERAVARGNDEVIGALDALGSDEITRIGDALDRLDKGSYGRCLRCAEPVEAARLRLMPYAEHCSRCAD